MLVGHACRLRRLGLRAFGRAFPRLARGDFALVVGVRGSGAFPGALFQAGAGRFHLLEQFFAPGDFLGQGLGTLVLLVGAFGLLEQDVDVLAQVDAQLLGTLVGDVFVL